jgi:hypothetical protein
MKKYSPAFETNTNHRRLKWRFWCRVYKVDIYPDFQLQSSGNYIKRCFRCFDSKNTVRVFEAEGWHLRVFQIPKAFVPLVSVLVSRAADKKVLHQIHIAILRASPILNYKGKKGTWAGSGVILDIQEGSRVTIRTSYGNFKKKAFEADTQAETHV